MPTLKGKWYFKEVLQHYIPDFSQSINYAITYIDGTTTQVIRMSMTSGILEYHTEQSTLEVYNYVKYWEGHNVYRNIDFGETPQEVSEEFYNWFTKNAVNLQPTGTWRFNKTLTSPPQSLEEGDFHVTTYYKGADDELNDYEIPFCTIHGINVDAYKLTADWGDYGYYCTQAGTGLIKFLYQANEQTWTSEEAREITFNNNLEYLAPDFALWFYENAHSTELKLYSECYIAETADKIRECANDNNLTFKVSDLADGVQLAYDAGYSKGSSENSLDLEALGALCSWELTSDSHSYPIITIINHHPTYYLKCIVADTDGNIVYALPAGSSTATGGVSVGDTPRELTVGPDSSSTFYVDISFSQGLLDGEKVQVQNLRWTANA